MQLLQILIFSDMSEKHFQQILLLIKVDLHYQRKFVKHSKYTGSSNLFDASLFDEFHPAPRKV